MDELKEAWQELKVETEGFTTVQRSELNHAITHRSHGTMEKLRYKVKIKFILAVIFSIVIAGIISIIDILPSQILLTILLGAYIVGSILLFQEMQYLKHGIDMTSNLKEGLTEYHRRIKQVMKYEELIGLTLYPVSMSAGFFIGMSIGAPDEPIMNEKSDWVALIITMFIVTPLAHWMAKWMNRIAFGKYLDQLQENIRELENFEA